MSPTSQNKITLKEARKTAGLTPKRAALFSNTPYRTWLSWEDEGPAGRRPPGIAFAWLELYLEREGEYVYTNTPKATAASDT